jgi:hypothetical protein
VRQPVKETGFRLVLDRNYQVLEIAVRSNGHLLLLGERTHGNDMGNAQLLAIAGTLGSLNVTHPQHARGVEARVGCKVAARVVKTKS